MADLFGMVECCLSVIEILEREQQGGFADVDFVALVQLALPVDLSAIDKGAVFAFEIVGVVPPRLFIET